MNSIIQKPWGTYQILEKQKNYLIKIIIVQPGEKLSLQSHEHRSEHWTIVEGVANITINDSKKILNSNESIFIPVKAKHRIENNQNNVLKIIEIQYGSNLSEDDIIRYEDIYNRV